MVHALLSSLRPQGRAERQVGVPFRDSPHRFPASPVVPRPWAPFRSACPLTVHGDDTEAGLQYMANEDNRADPATDDSGHGDGTDQHAQWGIRRCILEHP